MTAQPATPSVSNQVVSLPPLQPKQQQVWDILARAKRGTRTIIGYGGSMNSGKMLALDTPVPTPSGWTTMGEIQAGDEIFDEQGNITRVVIAHPIDMTPETYEVKFDDGTVILACADHQWLTLTYLERLSHQKRSEEFKAKRRASRPSRATGKRSPAFVASITARNQAKVHDYLQPSSGSIRTTREIAETMTNQQGWGNHAIPVAKPLNLPDVELPVDPYILGAWLGDGDKRGGRLTTSDSEMLESFKAAGFPAAKFDGKYTYTIPGLVTALRPLGVLNNKHIPAIYLRGSEAQRLALLQGLMDTDGTVDKAGKVSFTNTNRAIIDGVFELIMSLGMKANIVEGRAMLYGKDCGPVWDIAWTPSMYVFRLTRKLERQKVGKRPKAKYRYIDSCKPVAPVPMRCITVDSPSSLYLVGKQMVPTHNTAAICIIAWNIGLSYPGANIVIARQHQNSMKNAGGVMDQFYRLGPCEGNMVRDGGIITKRAMNNEPECHFRLPDWPPGVVSRIFFRGMSDTKFFASAEVTAILVDEADEISEYNITYALTRLRQRFPTPDDELGRKPKYLFLCGSNPAVGWFEDWFTDKNSERLAALKDIPDVGVIEFVPAEKGDNKFADEKYDDFMKAVLPEEMYASMGEGEFGNVAGRVFPNFSPNIHAIHQQTTVIDGLPHAGLDSWPEGSTRVINLHGARTIIPKFRYAIGGLDFAGAQKRAHLSTGTVSVVMENGRDVLIDSFGDNGPGIFTRQTDWMRSMEQALGCRIDWTADNTQPTGIQALRSAGFVVHTNEGKNDSWKTDVEYIRSRLMLDESGIPKSMYLDTKNNREWAKEMTGYRMDPVPNADGVFSERAIRVRDDRVDAYRYERERLQKMQRIMAPKKKLPFKHDTRTATGSFPMPQFDSWATNPARANGDKRALIAPYSEP